MKFITNLKNDPLDEFLEDPNKKEHTFAFEEPFENDIFKLAEITKEPINFREKKANENKD